MKKIIGILAIAVITATMFFSSNTVNSSSTDISLTNLTSINEAHAGSECDHGTPTYTITYFKKNDGSYIKICNNGGSHCC